MDVAPIHIFENQGIPMGLLNLLKSFKPNLATPRVFLIGSKFIPVWKKMKVVKRFAKFEDFRRGLSNKVFFEETAPGTFVRNKSFHIKKQFRTDKQCMKLIISVITFGYVLQTMGKNIQFETNPADQLPYLSLTDFRGGASVHRGPVGGMFRGRGRRGCSGGGYTRNQGENDAYSMDVAPIHIFENQVIPLGLHNISKSFRPNLTTTRVFSFVTKFIPVWKKMKITKPFAKFEDFVQRMSNKVFFEETTVQ